MGHTGERSSSALDHSSVGEPAPMVVAGVPIFYPPGQEAAAVAMAAALERAVLVVRQRWKLGVPTGCEVRVMTDWESFLDDSAPRYLRPWIRVTRPLWRGRVERTFALAGGWMMPWRGRPTVGVKPPELLPASQEGLGARLFAPVPDPVEKVKHHTCHEFTHACTAHLRLPAWLNEGLAMRAVDHMVGAQTVLERTRSTGPFDPSRLSGKAYRGVRPGDHDALIELYASGYWTTRRLEQEHPALLFELLRQRRPAREVNRRVAAAVR